MLVALDHAKFGSVVAFASKIDKIHEEEITRIHEITLETKSYSFPQSLPAQRPPVHPRYYEISITLVRSCIRFNVPKLRNSNR